MWLALAWGVHQRNSIPYLEVPLRGLCRPGTGPQGPSNWTSPHGVCSVAPPTGRSQQSGDGWPESSCASVELHPLQLALKKSTKMQLKDVSMSHKICLKSLQRNTHYLRPTPTTNGQPLQGSLWAMGCKSRGRMVPPHGTRKRGRLPRLGVRDTGHRRMLGS